MDFIDFTILNLYCYDIIVVFNPIVLILIIQLHLLIYVLDFVCLFVWFLEFIYLCLIFPPINDPHPSPTVLTLPFYLQFPLFQRLHILFLWIFRLHTILLVSIIITWYMIFKGFSHLKSLKTVCVYVYVVLIHSTTYPIERTHIISKVIHIVL